MCKAGLAIRGFEPRGLRVELGRLIRLIQKSLNLINKTYFVSGLVLPNFREKERGPTSQPWRAAKWITSHNVGTWHCVGRELFKASPFPVVFLCHRLNRIEIFPHVSHLLRTYLTRHLPRYISLILQDSSKYIPRCCDWESTRNVKEALSKVVNTTTHKNSTNHGSHLYYSWKSQRMKKA